MPKPLHLPFCAMTTTTTVWAQDMLWAGPQKISQDHSAGDHHAPAATGIHTADAYSTACNKRQLKKPP